MRSRWLYCSPVPSQGPPLQYIQERVFQSTDAKAHTQTHEGLREVSVFPCSLPAPDLLTQYEDSLAAKPREVVLLSFLNPVSSADQLCIRTTKA